MEKEKIRFTSDATLLILSARHIKQTKREFAGVGNFCVHFSYRDESGHIVLSIGDCEYHTKQSLYGVKDMLTRALEMSCDGHVYISKDEINVLVYGKPCNSFGILARAISKLTGVTIGFGDIMTESEDGNPINDKYLCHDEYLCRDALGFIRGKASRDVAKASVEKRGRYHYLLLEIKTPKGKEKASREYVV
jgi:hypothetical protein